jgi:hypothetical protein
MSGPPPFTVHELRAHGAAFISRANAHMAAARHGRSGDTYAPLTERPEEYAGRLILHHGSAAVALQMLKYDLDHVDPGEEPALWQEAYDLLARAVAHAGGRRPPPAAPA